MIETINKLVRTGRQFLHETGREATPEELAERLSMPLEKVRKVLKIAKEPISLETPIGDEEDSHLGDFIEDKNAVIPVDAAIQSNLKETVTRVLACLTPREERVLRMRFGIGMNTDHTLEEVGQQFSVTRERIRQIEAKALRKLKHPSAVAEDAELPRPITSFAGPCADRSKIRRYRCWNRGIDIGTVLDVGVLDRNGRAHGAFPASAAPLVRADCRIQSGDRAKLQPDPTRSSTSRFRIPPAKRRSKSIA